MTSREPSLESQDHTLKALCSRSTLIRGMAISVAAAFAIYGAVPTASAAPPPVTPAIADTVTTHDPAEEADEAEVDNSGTGNAADPAPARSSVVR